MSQDKNINLLILGIMLRKTGVFLLAFFLFCANWGVISALRLLSLDVPTSVRQGEAIWLNCTLDLETDELYSVKWYKNEIEFYRFLPRDSPRGQTYELPGVFVDLKRSRQGSVYLHTTDLNTEGLYRCEASAESPTFQTVEGEKQVKIYVLSQEGPSIQGNLPKYEVGEQVNVTCRSGPSKPAAHLKWFINGKEAPSNFITTSIVIDHMNGLQTSLLGLSFAVSQSHLVQGDGAIHLKCTAIVSQTYSMTSEELVVGDRLLESSSSPSDSNAPLINQFSPRNGPIISGGHPHYRVGDILDVNCTSSKTHSAPELQWFLNDKEVLDVHLQKYPNEKYLDGRESSILGLRFTVRPRHFDENEEIRLKCTATLSEVINRRSDERTVGGNHRSSGLHVPEDRGKVLDRNGCESFHIHYFSIILAILAKIGEPR